MTIIMTGLVDIVERAWVDQSAAENRVGVEEIMIGTVWTERRCWGGGRLVYLYAAMHFQSAVVRGGFVVLMALRCSIVFVHF